MPDTQPYSPLPANAWQTPPSPANTRAPAWGAALAWPGQHTAQWYPHREAPPSRRKDAKKLRSLFVFVLGLPPISFVLAELVSAGPEPSAAPFALFIALAIATMLGRRLWSVVGALRDAFRRSKGVALSDVSSGSLAFVPASVACLSAAGLVIGVVDGHSAVATCAMIGLSHGVLLWRLARRGWLYDPGRDLDG